jgi:glycosyltransferase involved in cell wall biosynthesis
MEACSSVGVPFVVIVHLVADALWPSLDSATRSNAIYPFASKVYFVSDENRISAGRQLGMDFANSAIVRNPFNVSFDTQIEWPPETGDWKLACVGRLGVEHKGQDLLVEVLSSSKWRERNLSVTLFGQGHHREYLDRLIAIRDCKNILFGGYTNGIPEVWRGHHAAIMPSRYEGLPIALVEAMICNRMAIVTDVGGNTELIQDGVTGFVAPFPNFDSLDSILEKAWAHREDWRSMGRDSGTLIRKIIPRDPIQEFIESIKSIIP